jgi:putative hydroxymethylpyrimidine transport system substrate-binding protein
VDAVGVNRNFETFELMDKGAKPLGFDYDKFGVPPFDELIMVVNKTTIHDPRYKRFLTAVREGSAYIKAHPEESWRMFIRAYPTLDNPLNHRAWGFTTPYFAADPASLDQAKYVRFGEFLVSNKVIKSAPPISTYAFQIK